MTIPAGCYINECTKMFSILLASKFMKVFLCTAAVLVVKPKASHTTHLGTTAPQPVFSLCY